MNGTAIITIVISILVLLATTGGLFWKISKNGSSHRGRIYERMDEIKEGNKKEFVFENVCTERHKRTDETMARIESKQDKMDEKIQILLNRHS